MSLEWAYQNRVERVLIWTDTSKSVILVDICGHFVFNSYLVYKAKQKYLFNINLLSTIKYVLKYI